MIAAMKRREFITLLGGVGGGMAGRVIGRARMSLVLPAGNVTSPRSSRPLTARALRCCFSVAAAIRPARVTVAFTTTSTASVPNNSPSALES